jgi:WD40 repeat protein
MRQGALKILLTVTFTLAPCTIHAAPAPRIASDAYGDSLPSGAVARHGTVRYRAGFTGGATFTTDGKRVVSSGGGNSLYFWDTDTGRLVRRYEAFSSYNAQFALSPNGKQLATGNYNENDVFLRTIDDGRVIRRLKGLKGFPGELQFSPDGNLLAAGDVTNGQAVIWDVRSGKEVTRLDMPRDLQWRSLYTLAFSGDGKYVAIADREAMIFEVKSWKLLTTLRGHTDHILRIAFTPNSARVVTGASDQTLRVWDRATGKEMRRISNDFFGALALSRDRETLYASERGHRLCAWTLDTGKRIYRGTEGPPAHGFSLSPDGSRLAGHAWSAVVVYDSKTGKCLTPMPVPAFPAEFFCFSPDGKSLGIGFRFGTDRVHLWSFRSGKITRLSLENACRAWEIHVTNEGRVFSFGSLPKKGIEMWDLAGKKRAAHLPGEGYYNSVVFAGDETVYAAGKDLIKWNTTANKIEQRIPLTSAHPCIFLSADRRVLLADRNHQVSTFDARSGVKRSQLKLGAGEYTLALSPDGHLFVTGVEPATSLRNTQDGAVVCDLNRKGVRAASFSPDGGLLAVADGEGAFQLWDVQARKRLRRLVGHRDNVVKLLFSPDGRWLASASLDTTVLVWDVKKIAAGSR